MTAWDKYGVIRGDVNSDMPMPKGPADLVLYIEVSRCVARKMAEAGIRERNWRRYRIASAAVEESLSTTPWSDNRRRRACVIDRGDFRERMGGIYAAALAAARINSQHPAGEITQSAVRMDAHRPRMATETIDGNQSRMAA